MVLGMGLRYVTGNKEFELCGGKLMLTVQKKYNKLKDLKKGDKRTRKLL